MSDDEIKKLILARRARFVAAAVAGLVACEPGVDGQPPSICLSISVPPADDGSAGPTIVDAGVSADPDASWQGDATMATEPDSDAPPMPCLAPPLPTVCLSVAPPPPQSFDAGKPPPRPCLSPKPPKPPPTASTPPSPPRICLSFSGPDD